MTIARQYISPDLRSARRETYRFENRICDAIPLISEMFTKVCNLKCPIAYFLSKSIMVRIKEED